MGRNRHIVHKSFLVVLVALLSATVHANSSDVAAFNTAWRAYEAAAAADDSEHTIDAASKVVETGKRLFADTDEELAVITHNYGVALSDGGRRKDAVPILKEAMRIGEAVYGENGVGLIRILADLADLAFRTSRNVYLMSMSDSASEYMSEARDIYASLPEPMMQNVGMANFYLGKMEFTDRDYRDSSDYLEGALDNFSGPEETNQALRLMTRALLVQAYEHRNLSEQATRHCVAIGRESQFSPDQDYQPLFRIAPMYPASMLRAGTSGHVDIEFVIDENGFVQEPVVVAREVNGKKRARPSGFDKAAMDAVKRFRYAPKFEDGQAVAVAGVATRITFTIE